MGDNCCGSNKNLDTKIDKCCTSTTNAEGTIEDINECCMSKEKEQIDVIPLDNCNKNDKDSDCSSETESEVNYYTPLVENEYRILGMDCPSCALTIEKGLNGCKGIEEAKVNFNTSKLRINSKGNISFDDLEKEIKKMGFSLEGEKGNPNYKTYLIEGMDCGACAKSIENHLKDHPSVKDVQVNFSTGKMKIEHGNRVEEIIHEVSKIGYEATIYSKKPKGEGSSVVKKNNGLVISGVFIALGFGGSFASIPELTSNILFAFAIILSGYKPMRSAFYALKSRTLDMNVLMSVAAIGAAIIGEWLEGAVVVWLFSLGNALQNRSIEQTRNSIRNLIDLAPTETWVKVNSKLIKKNVDEVNIGEIFIVKPGDKIALDGVIISGESSINQAPITGESMPVDKATGDDVYAGTINENGSLEVKVTKIAKDTTLSKIIHLVEEAQEKKAPTQAFVDKFASVYTPIVFILALLVMVFPPLLNLGDWGEWFYRGLELLVIACPCALVISTPVAIVSAIGNAAKNGVLIKGGTFLEKAGAINAIAFDKTGTLTEGKPKVSEVHAISTSEEELLSIASTLEEYSTHPIAKSIVNYANHNNIDTKNADSFKNIVGKGVQATIQDIVYYAGSLKLFEELGTPIKSLKSTVIELQGKGNTVIIVGQQNEVLGIIAVSDSLRNSSQVALQGLKQIGIKQVIMLTGDNEGTAKNIAKNTSIDRYFSELLPENKVDSVKQLQKEGYKVAMVGDGINDAPALATADLGIAMGGAGTDTAMETADIVLMADNLEKLPHTVKLSRKALRIIKQNIWFSLIVKFVALTFIFPGWLTLWIAVLSDTGAALIVILNSLRLLNLKGN